MYKQICVVLLLCYLFSGYFLYSTDIIKISLDDSDESFTYLRHIVGIIVNSTQLNRSDSKYYGSIVLDEAEYKFLMEYSKGSGLNEEELIKLNSIIKKTFRKRPFDYYYSDVVLPLIDEVSFLFSSYYYLILLVVCSALFSFVYWNNKEIFAGILVNVLLWSLYNVFAFVMYIWYAICLMCNYAITGRIE